MCSGVMPLRGMGALGFAPWLLTYLAAPGAMGEVVVEGEMATYVPDANAFGDDVFTFTVVDTAGGVSDGVATYTPLGDVFGPDSFTFTVIDSEGASSEEVTVEVLVEPAFSSTGGDIGADQGCCATAPTRTPDAPLGLGLVALGLAGVVRRRCAA